MTDQDDTRTVSEGGGALSAPVNRSKFKIAVALIVVLLPAPLRRGLLGALPGYSIHPTARLGRSFILADEFEMGPGSSMGHLNIVKDVRRFVLGAGARIDNGNHFFGGLGLYAHWPRTFEAEESAHVTSRHFVDLGGSVHLGAGTCLSGRGTQIWSHSFHGASQCRGVKPLEVRVGADTFIGAASVLVGCTIPAGSSLAAGTVFTERITDGPGLLIRGNPGVARPSRGPS